MDEVNIIKPVYPGWRINPKSEQQKKQRQPNKDPQPEPRDDDQEDDGLPHVDDYA